MGKFPPSPQASPRPFSGLGFTLVLLIHAVVLSLLMQSRSVAMPIKEDVLQLSILQPPLPQETPRSRSATTVKAQQKTLQSPPPPIADSTRPPTISIAVETTTTPAMPPVASLTQPRFDADYLDNPAPPYPPMSRRLGEQGRVVLRVFVLPNGQADAVLVQTSSNSSRLDQSARETVSRWRFLPARRGEEAVAAWVLVPIAFSLNT
jgi:protein TonB